MGVNSEWLEFVSKLAAVFPSICMVLLFSALNMKYFKHESDNGLPLTRYLELEHITCLLLISLKGRRLQSCTLILFNLHSFFFIFLIWVLSSSVLSFSFLLHAFKAVDFA